MIFVNKIIRSTLTLYIANIGINAIIIGLAQQWKPKFSLLCKILKELHNSPLKNIPFFQNADSQVPTNTVIRSILTSFTRCKHTHQYYIDIIQIFELRIFNCFKAFVTSRCCAHETINPWSSPWFHAWLIISGKQFVCRSLLFTKGKKKQKSQSLFRHSFAFSNLKFLFGLTNYIWYLLVVIKDYESAFDGV